MYNSQPPSYFTSTAKESNYSLAGNIHHNQLSRARFSVESGDMVLMTDASSWITRRHPKQRQ